MTQLQCLKFSINEFSYFDDASMMPALLSIIILLKISNYRLEVQILTISVNVLISPALKGVIVFIVVY